PWDNIQMAPRPADAPRPAGGGPADYDVLAVKCDLCRAFEGPACVQACPTESIFRVNPTEDIADVRALLGGGPGEARAAPTSEGGAWALGSGIAALAIGAVGRTMQARGLFSPQNGLGFAAGVGAALGMVGLLAYAWPKRRIRSWMRPRAAERRDAALPSV